MVPQTLPSSQKSYLKPSIFWSIRQGFPRWLSILLAAAALIVPLIGWAILSYGGITSQIILPTPTSVIKAGIQMFTEDNLLQDIIASSLRVAGGFLAAAVIGIPIGIAMGTFYSINSLFSPIVGTVRYMPAAAFTPLILVWFGLGEDAKVVMICLGIVFYNAIMIADAVKFIPSELLNVAYTLGSTRRDLLLRVILPATLPSVLDTLRVNIAGAWNFLVIAEVLGAESGLGYKIVQSQRFLQTDKIFFAIAVIGVIGLLTDYVLGLISKLLTPWADQARG